MREEESVSIKADHLLAGVAEFEEGSRVLTVKSAFSESQIFGSVGFFFWKEVPGAGDMAFSPAELMHFGEIFAQVGVAVKGVVDLSDIDNGGPGEFHPELSDYLMWNVAGSDEEMEVGPPAGGDFGHSEIFEVAEATSELAGEEGDFGAGCIEGFAGGEIKFRVNCEGKKTVGRRFGNAVREAFGLVLRTGSAAPFIAGEWVENKLVEVGREGDVGLGVWTAAQKGAGGGDGIANYVAIWG